MTPDTTQATDLWGSGFPFLSQNWGIDGLFSDVLYLMFHTKWLLGLWCLPNVFHCVVLSFSFPLEQLRVEPGSTPYVLLYGCEINK